MVLYKVEVDLVRDIVMEMKRDGEVKRIEGVRIRRIGDLDNMMRKSSRLFHVLTIHAIY